jgi:hypothetical protein
VIDSIFVYNLVVVVVDVGVGVALVVVTAFFIRRVLI